jgi:S-adenosylmethionine:tRNA ribosyltransferase-isomerase
VKVSDFDFDLPESQIALRPVEPRDSAKLLVVDPSQSGFSDRQVVDLPGLLQPGDALVFNNTKVIPARLRAKRVRGEAVASIEIMLHQRIDEQNWHAFLRPGKKANVGETLTIDEALSATVVEKHETGDATLRFNVGGPALDQAIAQRGEIPLPPYIEGKRQTDARDTSDYQTTYAKEPGAVAAPTAGLHFTGPLLDKLQQHGVSLHFLTLHVGAGTFLPVKVDNIADHKMHAEWGQIPEATADALNATRKLGGRIIAVGTTSMRLLESAALDDGTIRPFADETAIFITPGYHFKAVDGLMTNFHLPRSTLFMLVSAFAGFDRMRGAYQHAISHQYRFYSYGDSSLLWRDRTVSATAQA